MRDKLKDKEYFDAYLKQEYERLENYRNVLSQEDIHPQYRSDAIAKASEIKLDTIIARYSKGDSIEDIRGDFSSYVSESAILFERKRYGRMLQIASLSRLLQVDDEYLLTVRKQYEETDQYDWLIQYLLMNNDDGSRKVSTTLVAPKLYEGLRNSVLENDVNAETIKKYLSRWYQKQSCYGWYDTHKSKFINYSGYWAFEAGAIAKIHHINDELLKEHEYYPYDLVHFSLD